MMTETAGEKRGRRRLGWYLLAVAAIPLALLATLLIPNAAGPHADSHVFSAAQYGVQVLIVVGLAVMLRGTLDRLSLAVLALPMAGVLFGAFASAKIAHLIWHKNWDNENAGDLGESLPGFEHWHELAEQADTAIMVGGIAFALTVLLTRRAGKVAPVVAIVLSLTPAWIFPALGCSFLLADIAARHRDLSNSREARP
jgi:drug/metabolite transporter (DMT)-like permease